MFKAARRNPHRLIRNPNLCRSPYQPVVKVPRAPRPFLRPPDKALEARILDICDRIATQSAGMGRSNAVTTFATGCYTK